MVSTSNKTAEVLKYALLPRVLPRVAQLFFSGFEYFAFFIAQVYRGVRLLPEGHAFLNPANIGAYNIADVVGAAGRGLKFRMANIDQVIIFFAILLGLALLGLQAIILCINIFMPKAMAMGALSFGYYFGANPYFGPDQDLAFILLDRVFGIPGMFESCVDTSAGVVPCYKSAPDLTFASESVYTPAMFPWPFHEALHALFEYYSTGLLVVAMAIVLYFVIVVAAETAQTGTPFGKRFNGVWAPIRLVWALGLLIPISYGMNSAQYITLYAAKWGSNFATNGWVLFNENLSAYASADEMVAKPQGPDPREVLQFMMLAHACKALEEGYIQDPAVEGSSTTATCGVSSPDDKDKIIDGYLVKVTGDASTDSKRLADTSYPEALDFFNNSDIVIRFGDRGCSPKHDLQGGHTLAYCGELVLPVSSLQEQGALAVQEGYYNTIKYLWGDYASSKWDDWGFCDSGNYGTMMSGSGDIELRKRAISVAQSLCPEDELTASVEDFTSDWANGTAQNYAIGDPTTYSSASPLDPISADGSYSPADDTVIVENVIRQGVVEEQAYFGSGAFGIPNDLLARGWAGAGIWYNHIAQMNGALTGAVGSFPQITHYPIIMESVLAQKRKNNSAISPEDQFNPTRAGTSALQLSRPNETASAAVLNNIFITWRSTANEHKPKAGNMIYDAINWIFGTRGLFNLRDPANEQVHPLAQLASMGKGLLDASIRNIGLGFGAQLGGMLGNMAGLSGDMARPISGFIFSLANLTLAAGVILYYIVPFMPFLYFFFAVGNWVKGIFEAMVGVPLWALAHIRIDGDGLPGDAARQGYFIIFEIFIRPICIVFGLLAAISIFAAMATTLNSIYDMVVINTGGADFTDQSATGWADYVRGPIDQLFYTVLYAAVLYIMALSSFKLIDLIPSQIMRWMGSGVSGFQGGDNAMEVMNMGKQGIGMAQGAISAGQSVGNAAMDVGSAINRMAKPPK